MVRTAAHDNHFFPSFFHILLSLLFMVCATEGLAETMRVTTSSRAIMNTSLTAPYREENQALSIVNTVVETPFLQPKTQFNNTISFISAHFREKVGFNLAIFMDEVTINNVTFDRIFNAGWAIFNGKISIFDARFKDSASFFYCIFAQPEKFFHIAAEKEVTFQRSTFNEAFELSHSTFQGDTSFYGVHFEHGALFRLDDFAKGVDFSYARFNNGVAFQDSVFKGITNFSNAVFHGKVSFNRSLISGMIDFSYVTITDGEIDLTQLEKKNDRQRIKINLVGAAIDKINFYYTDFELYFPENIPETGRLLVYKSLLNNFQRRGYTSSYERLYPEYEAYRYQAKGQNLFNIIQKYWWNYGVNKERVFNWVAFFLVLFTLINALFFSALLKKYCSVPFLDKAVRDYSVISNPVTRYIYYLPGAFVFTVILFFGGFLRMGISIKDFTSNNMLVNLYLMLIISIGTICILFIFKYLMN